MKKIITFALCCLLVSYTALASIPTLHSTEKKIKAKSLTERETDYVWVLHNNGCFYLYRVDVYDGILEFWVPLTPFNWGTSYVNCVYSEDQMDTLC